MRVDRSSFSRLTASARLIREVCVADDSMQGADSTASVSVCTCGRRWHKHP